MLRLEWGVRNHSTGIEDASSKPEFLFLAEDSELP